MMRKINVLCAARDSRVMSRLRRELDDSENLSFSIVSCGDAAYAGACRFAPDILVLDAVLEGMDGLAVMDRLCTRLGDRMPRVIGGAMMPFAERGFAQRGARAVVRVPWDYEELRAAILMQIEALECEIDWARAHAPFLHACALLEQMGMKASLKGYVYLAWAAALAHQNEARLFSVGDGLYRPVALRFDTTPQSVERLIRHAVESAMDAIGAKEVYAFFGNTIDPTRGKPTNAQILGALVQRMRLV